jgi:hypothetical protein
MVRVAASNLRSCLNPSSKRGSLYQRIAPHAHVNRTSSLFIYMGSAALAFGRLAFIRKELVAARRHDQVALEFNRTIGSAAAVLFTQHEYGLVLQRGGAKERRGSEAARDCSAARDRVRRAARERTRGIAPRHRAETGLPA